MNTSELIRRSHRLLVIDDNPRIHEDIRKILCPIAVTDDLASEEAAIFGGVTAAPEFYSDFEINSAYQGQEGLALVEQALAADRPYSMAFVDVRMPPGWDGVETIENLWKVHPELQVVICTAYSDHTWEEIIQKLGKSDSLLILKKPFDNVEVLQLAHALTKKWVVTLQAKSRLNDLENMVARRTTDLVQANAKLHAEVIRRARIEDELRNSEERFHKSFESALVSLAIFKADTLEHVDVNSSYLTLTGYTREQVLGKTPRELQLAEQSDAFDAALRSLELGQRIHNLEMSFSRRNQGVRQTLVSIVPLVLADQSCYLAAVQDITEQRQVESQLRQSQKMEAIGQLAAGVAHDFNNLLTVIIGHASIQLRKAHLEQGVQKSLEQVKLAGERASGLTRQLLAFSRKQVLQRHAVDVATTVKNMQSMLSRLVGEVIAFEVVCGEKVPCVLGDDSSVEQAVLNLVVNARDAMAHGGKLMVRVDQEDVRATAKFTHPDARAGRFVVLSVSDTGCGMDAETQRRIYEPFFTTKPVGKGTGLGLATIYGIVKQHQGWIELQSEVGKGTTFRVFFPATDEIPKKEEALLQLQDNVDCRECVLVVEDEPQVRAYVCDALRAHGYRVLDADCGQKAIDVWKNAKNKVDLLLTDMVMPNGVSGGDLAKTLRQNQQDLKIIYMSGYSTEFVNNEKLLEKADYFLSKPFSQGKLLSVVDEVVKPVPRAASA